MTCSLDCESDTNRGCTACSSPTRSIRATNPLGVSFPSSCGTVNSFTPAIASGAPHSSTLMCAVSVQITAWYGRQVARMASTFAPLPLKTGNTRAASPNSWRNSASSSAVKGSCP